MRKHSTHSRMFETLENRCLLSVSPTAVAAPVVTTATSTVVPATTAPRLVGSYKGTVTLTIPSLNASSTFNMTWVIKTQTATSVTGTINIGGIIGTGTFTGSIDSKGDFKYKIQIKAGVRTENVTINGHLVGKTLTGTLTFMRGTTTFMTGTFKLAKP